jgi:hypothetical protein
MFNKIRNLFKKKEQVRLPADAEKTKKRLIGSLHGTPVYVSGEYTNTTLILPKLSKAELRVLNICLEFIINYGNVTYTDIANCSPSQTQRQIQSLITKGYLIRVKRGVYKLSFYK